MRVRAVARGLYGGRLTDPGTEFEIVSDDHLASWMEPTEEKDRARFARGRAESLKGLIGQTERRIDVELGRHVEWRLEVGAVERASSTKRLGARDAAIPD